jgi:uncharacterized membrane protein YidH (DUF202 family)
MGISNLLNIAGVLSTIQDVCRGVATFTLAAVAALAVVFAIWIGFKLATAEEDGKRKDAKMQLIYAIIGMIVAVSLALVVGLLEPALQRTVQNGDVGGLVGSGAALSAIGEGVNAILSIVTALATVFAVYIAWQFIKAEDDGKRKQAKTQLIWTIVGIIAIVVITMIADAVIGGLTAMI